MLQDRYKLALPGRMNELELMGVELGNNTEGRFLVFSFVLDKDLSDLIQINFDVDRRVWWVYIDDMHFEEIPCSTVGGINDNDALNVFKIVLLEYKPKTTNGMEELRNWRNKLQVWPAKLLTLNK